MLKKIEAAGRNLLRSILVPGAIAALREASAKAKSVDEIVKLVREFNYLHIRIAPSQIKSEITSLLNLLAENPPKTILEIGTNKGGTFFLFSKIATPDATLLSLDLPQGRFGGGYYPWQGKLYRSFARDQQRIELVLGDSHSQGVADNIKQLLGGRPLDFLFIDGDHSYEGVKQDFEMYSPLVKPDGVIAFHDIAPGPEASVGGVPRFWQELKATRPVIEFVDDWKQGAYGIGVLKLGSRN
jgi:predicted O-methyltransferase YrrM